MTPLEFVFNHYPHLYERNNNKDEDQTLTNWRNLIHFVVQANMCLDLVFIDCIGLCNYPHSAGCAGESAASGPPRPEH